MPPVASSQHSVYCALPGRDLAQVVGQRRVDERRGAGPGDHRLAEVADVEDADRLADRGVLLDHAGGVLQRHRPAAELGELGAERDVPVVQGRRRSDRVGHGREPTAASAGSRPGWLACPGDDVPTRCAAPAPPRPAPTPSSSGSCRPTRASARARRAEDVAEAYGRKLRPLLATLGRHRQGRRGRQGADRRARSPSPLLVLVGLGKAGRTPSTAVRRAAGVAARARHQRRLGRPRPARRHARAGARGHRGLRCSAATRYTTYKKTATTDDQRARRGRACSARSARKQEAVAGLRGGPGRRRGRRRDRATGSTRPPGDLTPAGVRRRGRRGRAKRAHQGPRRAQGRRSRSSTRSSSPSSAAAASSASATARPRRRGWSS